MAKRAKKDLGKPVTWCPECGSGVPIDEDGLCATCGATAIGPGADLALNALASVSREKARADAAEARVRELEAQKNGAYSERNKCVALIARMAVALGLRAGVGRHVGGDWEDDWRTIVFIDLPVGQVSWHFHDSERELLAFLSEYADTWDGHDTAEKYRRALTPSVFPLEAQCAAMREALDDAAAWIELDDQDPSEDDERLALLARCRSAFSGDAGRAMMERVEALERVAEEADATAVAADPSSSLWAALHALRALEPKR